MINLEGVFCQNFPDFDILKVAKGDFSDFEISK